MHAKGMAKKYALSVLITLGIIAIIFLIGPVAALILTIDGLPASIGSFSALVFFLNFNIGPGELIPGGFTLSIDGSTCDFDVFANELGGALCGSVDCTVVTKTSSSFGQFNANGSLGSYGYGYGYQYGYGYGNGELRYRCTWNTPCVITDSSVSIFFTTTVDSTVFTSGTYSVSVLADRPCRPPSSGGSSSGVGTGFCCDPIVNYAQWHCCQKAYIARVQCCAQPEHPDCQSYCELLSCIYPYKQDPATGQCVKRETLLPQTAPPMEEERPPAAPAPSTPETGPATGMAFRTEGSTGNATFWAILFLLIAAAILAYLLWPRRRI